MLPDFEMPFKPSEGDGNEKDQNQNDSKTTTTTTTTTTSDSTGISITPENNASAIVTPYSSLASLDSTWTILAMITLIKCGF